MDSLCCVCGNKTKGIDFNLNSCVSSDAKLINHSIAHSYCQNCGYVFIDKDNRVDYHKFYTDEYDFLLDGDVEPTIGEVKYSEYLVAFYSEYIQQNESKTFFDIGGGKGNFINAMYENFSKLQYTALEPSKSFEIMKKKSFIQNLYNDFFDSKNFKVKYNFLSLIGVLEHVPNPKSFLLDIKDIMDESSYLLIEVPNFKNNKSDLLTIDHISKFTEKSIENLFAITGFEVVKKQTLLTVPMQYIIKIGIEREIKETNINIDIKTALDYLKLVFDDARQLKDKKISIYGQGLVMEYLLGMNILNLNNIACIVDDNPLYQGKKWKNKLPIVDFETFKEKYNTKIVYLAMNDCYHEKILNKLDKYTVAGIFR